MLHIFVGLAVTAFVLWVGLQVIGLIGWLVDVIYARWG